MYPKSRIEAFGDAIFGVSMTLLAVDVRLPEDFHPVDSAQMLHGVMDLWPKFLPYALSFYVLGMRWLGLLRLRSDAESYGPRYAKYWLLFLFLVTCVPFTTIVVGRYVSFAPAIWLYAGNTALIGLVSFALIHHTPGMDHDAGLRERQISQLMLIVSALLAIAWSFVDPRQALWALALNVLSPFLARWRRHA